MKIICTIKGQIIPKADWSAMDPPKKRTDKFVFLLVYSSRQKNPNSFIHFLGESIERKSAYGFN